MATRTKSPAHAALTPAGELGGARVEAPAPTPPPVEPAQSSAPSEYEIRHMLYHGRIKPVRIKFR